jgi:AcrR family transcriptional regulator
MPVRGGAPARGLKAGAEQGRTARRARADGGAGPRSRPTSGQHGYRAPMTTAGGHSLRVDAARNYERIVLAAGQAFEDVGPDVTLEEVARRAGVGVATVYRRFQNRDQLVRAVLEHLLTTEIEPAAAVHTDDPWQDLVGSLETTVDVLAGHQVVRALARETDAVDVQVVHRYLRSLDKPLRRAIAAKLVRPELEARDLAAVVVMALATAHSGDAAGADRRRYLALLIDGLRPAPTTLPPPSTAHSPTRGHSR